MHRSTAVSQRQVNTRAHLKPYKEEIVKLMSLCIQSRQRWNVLSRLPADSATREQQGKMPMHAIHSSMQQVNGRGELLRYRGGKDVDHLQVSQVRTATPRSAYQPHACRDRVCKSGVHVSRCYREQAVLSLQPPPSTKGESHDPSEPERPLRGIREIAGHQ